MYIPENNIYEIIAPSSHDSHSSLGTKSSHQEYIRMELCKDAVQKGILRRWLWWMVPIHRRELIFILNNVVTFANRPIIMRWQKSPEIPSSISL